VLKRHATGSTLALAIVFAVALSLAPIPEAFRPFPTLQTEDPGQLLTRLLLPSGGDVHAQDAVTGAPDVAPPENLADERQTLDEPPPVEEQNASLALLPAHGSTRLYAGLPSFEIRRARTLDRWADRVGASRGEIEEGCLQIGHDGECERRALDNFFERLEPLRRGDGTLPVRIVHLGDSQIASDYIADLLRRRLEFRYGSSGRGFLFVDRPTRFSGKKVRTGDATEGWAITKITDRERSGILGFSGVRFTAADGQRTRFEVGRARFLDVAFVTSRQGGMLEITGDGRPLAKLLTRFEESALAFSKFSIPPGVRAVSLHTASGEVSLLGAALESGAPGIVYDTIGLPGAMFDVFLRSPERSFQAHLARRDPALVVIMLGGNEAYEIGRKWQTLEAVRTSARKLVQRIQSAAPAASCLLLSPLDAGIRNVSGTIVPRTQTRDVGKAIRDVALASGCGFWNVQMAMGGEGAAARWYEEELFHPDLVHPRRRGADLLAHLLDGALEQARQKRRGMIVAHVEPTQIEDASGKALQGVFDRIRSLVRGVENPPPKMVQFAAESPASDRFAAAVRKRFTASFPARRAPTFESVAAMKSSPDLVVLEPGPGANADITPEFVREEALALLSVVRGAAPGVACLIIGPPDRLRPLAGGGYVAAESVDVYTRALREVAATERCAFWSARGAMGGRGAIRRWQTLDPALADANGMQLTAAGVDMLGDAFAEEFVAAYRMWSAASEARAQAGAGAAGGGR